MRFITRTLPWVVILVVIAFFIGLKQTSNPSSNSADPSAEKKVTKKTTSTSKNSVIQAISVKSVTSVSRKEQKPVPILEEKTTTKEDEAVEEETATEEKPCPEGQDLPKTSTRPEDQPAPTDGDPVNIKLFEGAVEKEDPNQPAKSSENRISPDSQDAPDSGATTAIDPATISPEGPILLSMSPPLLNQPIINPSGKRSGTDWKWSQAVKQVQVETASDAGHATGNSTPVDQDEMPNMYGPAKEDPAVTVEVDEEVEIKENNVNNGTSVEEEVEAKEGVEATNAAKEADDAPQKTDEPASEKFPSKEESSPQKPHQREPLSPEMQKLRDGVRQTINAYSKPILNTRDNTVAQLLDVCEAFGCNAEVMYTDKRQKINAFANLCYNYPCAGYRPLKVSHGQIVPKIGYGFQEKPGQMLAVMALGRVPENYPIQVNKEITGTVADLVEREKKTCRSGQGLSFKLIGIARYTPSDETWKSGDGQTWTVQRLVREVLEQPAKIDTVAGINRLLALSYAVQQRTKEEKPLDGAYAKATKYLGDFQEYALSMINNDGTWHPQFLKAKGIGRSGQGRLRSTGHILRWLVFSLPEEQLQDPRIIRAIVQVQRSLAGNARYGLASASPRTIDSRLTAVHALVLYDKRFFKPYDAIEVEETAAETAQSTKTGVR